jgi:hypothetical protein
MISAPATPPRNAATSMPTVLLLAIIELASIAPRMKP